MMAAVMRVRSVSFVGLVILCCGGAMALAATAPTVRTGRASAVTPQTATLNGWVNPHGVPTAFYFAFGRTTRYGSRTSTSDAGSATTRHAVSASLTGLRPHSTYHYRLVAFSAAGTTRGTDRTLKTPQIPTTSTISVSQNPVVYSKTVLVTGSLIGPGVGGKKVALESKPFPFTDPFGQAGNTVLTGPDGAYSFVLQPLITTQLRVADQSKPSVVSPTLIENVALAVTLRVRHLRRGRHRILFKGHVTPARVGNPVLIQRKTRRGWATVAFTLTRARTASFSGFKRRLRLHRRGKYRAAVKTTGGDYVDGTSRAVRVSPRRHHRRR
jgi:hypothetical protein